jgi:NTE family protein
MDSRLRVAVTLLAALLLAGCPLEGGKVSPARLPRFEPVPKAPGVALVLGSGGPRGFAHIGVLKVLDDMGVRPDLIVGSSAGALVGALYASGMDARAIERLATQMSLIRFLEPRELVGEPGTGRPVEDFVNEAVGGRAIEQLPIALAIAATRLRDRRLALFDHGDTGLAVRASAADPDRFAPVPIGGELYADGDELSPVPIRAARQLGARVVIAVDVSAYARTTPPGVPQAWIDKDARRARQVLAEAPEADVLLHPDIGYYAGISEDYRRRVIAIAEQYTRERIPAIRAALGAARLETGARDAAGGGGQSRREPGGARGSP